MRRIISTSIILVLLVIGTIGFAKGEYNMPLEKGETLLIERKLQDGSIEVFVEKEDEYYKKVFKRDQTSSEIVGSKEFSLVSNEKVKKHGTGLIMKEGTQEKNAEDKVRKFIASKRSGN